MNIYTNGFRCASNEDRSEVVVHFVQNAPASETMMSGSGARTESEVVSQLVMSKETALNLVYVLTDMLNIQTQ